MKNIFTKIAIVAAMVLPAQLAFSQSSSHDGLYMGVDGTYDITRFDHYEVTSLTDMEPTDNKLVYNDEGPAAGIFVGYRLSDGLYTFAAEARYGYSFIENNLISGNTYKQTNEFGVSLLPGYWLQEDFLIFTRFGVSQQTTTRTFEGILNQNSDSGFHFGAGVEVFINEQLSLRGEYNRSTFQHEMSQVFVDGTTDPETVTQVDFKNKFRRDRFQISMVARF